MMKARINADGTIVMWAILGLKDDGGPRIIGLFPEEKGAWRFVIDNLTIKNAAVQKIELDTNKVEDEPTPEEVTQQVLKASSEYAQEVIEKSAQGGGTEVDSSKQVKWDDQPEKVREVLALLTADQLTVLRIATRHFDGHPGVDSGTIVYYKPEFLAVALIGSVEDHVQTLDGDGSKGMTSKGLTVTLEILEIFHTVGFAGVSVEDLAHVEMERDDERGREMAQEVSR